LKGEDIEIALTHSKKYSEEYHSFVNGQNTTHRGTHLAAYREAIVKPREFYNKSFEASDVRKSIVSAISIVMEPVLNHKLKLRGSADMGSEAGCRQCELY
jgi:topoisomerase-4 subunit B